MAADQGYAIAQSDLGGMYYSGHGVIKNYVTAYAWVLLGTAQGDAQAIKNAKFIEKSLTRTQIAEGQRLARTWQSRKRVATSRPRAQEPQRTQTAQVSSYSDLEICRVALIAPPTLEWDTNPALDAYVATARSRGLSLQRCATLLGRDSIAESEPRERPEPPKSVAKRTPSPPPASPPSGPSREQIMQIQRGLASLGYDPGTADGVLGSKSREAIRAFQRDYDFPVTGGVSERLDVAIRTAKRAVASARPPPQPQPQPLELPRFRGRLWIWASGG